MSNKFGLVIKEEDNKWLDFKFSLIFSNSWPRLYEVIFDFEKILFLPFTKKASKAKQAGVNMPDIAIKVIILVVENLGKSKNLLLKNLRW